MTTLEERTVREIALEEPSSVRVFESLGIDYCCGGKRRLTDACTHANVDLTYILNRLQSAKQKEQTLPGDDWSEKPLSKLTAFIVDAHHDYVRREIPRIEGLFGKVLTRHGQAHPEIARAQELWQCRICGKSRIDSACGRTAGGGQAAIPNNRSMNRFWPRTSPFGNQRIWPFRMMFIASYPAIVLSAPSTDRKP